MSSFEQSQLNRVKRVSERAAYDRETIYRIVDDALVCHVGFVQAGQPFVIPTIHARDGDRLILHGAASSRMLKHISERKDICVTITFVDGLVLARSVFHHSMNYRSAILFGTGRLIEDEEEKWRGFKVLTDHIMPGRWEDARQPNRKELKATSLVAMDIETASAKIRTGPPIDDEEDYELPIWAGVLPIRRTILPPIADDKLNKSIVLPEYIEGYPRKD